MQQGTPRVWSLAPRPWRAVTPSASGRTRAATTPPVRLHHHRPQSVDLASRREDPQQRDHPTPASAPSVCQPRSYGTPGSEPERRRRRCVPRYWGPVVPRTPPSRFGSRCSTPGAATFRAHDSRRRRARPRYQHGRRLRPVRGVLLRLPAVAAPVTAGVGTGLGSKAVRMARVSPAGSEGFGSG
jgi:hypothetical protein